MEIRRRIQAIRDDVIALRRDFHRHPELGLEEHRTSGKILAHLEACGLETGRANRTGVVGLLRGSRSGPTLLLRADMDALPIAEENEVPYKSVNQGVMHACGHDAHCAMLLGAVKILSAERDSLAGNIKFVFQPNEENVGALGMIEEGVLENPRVDACLGLHVWTPLPSGTIGLTAGAVMAGMEHFDLTITGKGGHTATPQSAIDPILTAAHVVQAVQMIQTREIDPLKEPTVIMFGKIGGGTASNVIPDLVQLSGTMRYLFAGAKDSEDNPKRRFERIVAHVCAAHRAGHQLEFVFGHPALVNHAGMVELVRRVVTQMPEDRPKIESAVTLAGEDFSEFTARVPGAFYFLGAGSEEKQTHFPHHHPRFNLDEDILTVGVELHVRTALRYLNDHYPNERR